MISNKWYEHKPEGVIENDHVKLLWDFNIQTTTYIQARRPDVVVVDRYRKTCNIIDIAVPGDAGIVEKEKEKVEKYQDLRREVVRLWDVKAKVVLLWLVREVPAHPNFLNTWMQLVWPQGLSFYRKQLSLAQRASSDGY